MKWVSWFASSPCRRCRFTFEKGNERYHSYFEMSPGIWLHGDWLRIRPSGGSIIYGRSDATINRCGIRMGTTELFRAVEAMPEALYSLVVDLRNLGRESYRPLFDAQRRSVTLAKALNKRLCEVIKKALSARLVPSKIFQEGSSPPHAVGQEVGGSGEETADGHAAARSGFQVRRDGQCRLRAMVRDVCAAARRPSMTTRPPPVDPGGWARENVSPEPLRRACVAAALGVLAGGVPPTARAAPKVRPRIVLLTPNAEGNTYWPQVFRIIERVSQTLDFEFAPYSFGVVDRYARRSAALRILATEPRPNAVIVPPVFGHSAALLEAAEALGIPMFLLGPLFPSELPGIGESPRKKYKSWAALFNQAEEEMGYALGKALLEAAEQQQAFTSDGAIQVIGVGGNPRWFGSDLRQSGLMRAVRGHPRAAFKQVVPTQWTQEEGRQLTAKLLKRYPQARVVWAASDQLGAGAAQALTEQGLTLGKNAFTGGLDLSALGLNLVREGKFVATAASTLLSYAQVAVLAYDHLHGFDVAERVGSTLEFPTLVATKANVDMHLRLSGCVQSIDFRNFSRVYRPTLGRFDFTLDAYRKAAGPCMGS